MKWQDWLALETTDINGLCRIIYRNGALVGEVVQDVDGYWKYSALDVRSGLWDAYLLEMIAAMLNEMNKSWDDEIREFFENEKRKDDE